MVYPSNSENLPVVVIGAGPIGLAAAVHLLERGITPLVLEAGSRPGAAMLDWGHVQVFSPWKYMVDPLARRKLEAAGWSMPDEEALPLARDFVSSVLEPLAALPAVQPHVRYDQRVISVTRHGFDKLKSAGRDAVPFEVMTRGARGDSRILARAVIDASGTWTSANPLGSGGVPASGERELSERIHYGIPDVRGSARSRYAGRRVLVVGSGHSAFNSLLDLAWLKTEVPETDIVWAIRRTGIGLLFGGGAKDALPARGSLGDRLRQLVEIGVVQLITGLRATQLSAAGDRVLVSGVDQIVGPVDEIIVAAGFRPDLDMLREIRVGIDPLLESTVTLAPLIDPNVHSCGTVYPHGYRELQHPEKDFYTVGMKSYGRAPNFLLLTGYEQVRSVAAALAGDFASAGDVNLVLPETGVCSTDLGGGGTCCSTAQPAAAGCGCG